jgi:hypothetical protein
MTLPAHAPPSWPNSARALQRDFSLSALTKKRRPSSEPPSGRTPRKQCFGSQLDANRSKSTKIVEIRHTVLTRHVRTLKARAAVVPRRPFSAAGPALNEPRLAARLVHNQRGAFRRPPVWKLSPYFAPCLRGILRSGTLRPAGLFLYAHLRSMSDGENRKGGKRTEMREKTRHTDGCMVYDRGRCR